MLFLINLVLLFDFIMIYIGLKVMQGNCSIYYWKLVLMYNFNQNVGLSLDYLNGLLFDSGDVECKWGLGVLSKF